LFWLPDLGKASAELEKAEKNKMSHRGMAMAQFRAGMVDMAD
jgi:XTP/dITP diphosphohydrolase